MAEKSARQSKSAEHVIPDEARSHLHAARAEMRASIKALFPPEFINHRRKARKEMLLAWRSLIDSALQRLEEKENKTT